MLSKDLYKLCENLSCYISNEKNCINDLSIVDDTISSYINSKKNFMQTWIKLLNLNYKNIDFSFNYNIIDQNSVFMKIVLNLQRNFLSYNINSSSTHSYIIILHNFNNSYKIIHLVSYEDTPHLYSSLLKSSLDDIYLYSDINSSLEKLWNYKYSIIDNLCSDFSNIHNLLFRENPSFNINSACKYAEKYAITPNPEYKDFTDIGGDCTNFVSQILSAGGINTTNTWHPYSNAWVRVKELYEYLTNSYIAHALPNNIGLDKGCLIQFFIPTTNRFSHTGFITHNIKGVDYLFCCHSYNRLNYPLGLLYPVKYKSMRSLMIK